MDFLSYKLELKTANSISHYGSRNKNLAKIYTWKNCCFLLDFINFSLFYRWLKFMEISRFYKKEKFWAKNLQFWPIVGNGTGLKNLSKFQVIGMNQNAASLSEKCIKNVQFKVRHWKNLHYGTIFSKNGQKNILKITEKFS